MYDSIEDFHTYALGSVIRDYLLENDEGIKHQIFDGLMASERVKAEFIPARQLYESYDFVSSWHC